MRPLQYLLYILLTFLGLILILGFVAPKSLEVSESREIMFSPNQVFEVVNDFNTWPTWSPWIINDSTINIQKGAQMKGPGASYSWVSELQGDGSQTITAAIPSESISTAIEFDGRPATAQWKFTPTTNGTTVRWSMNAKFPYPFNAFLMFSDMESTIREDFEKGLRSLGQYVSQQNIVRESTIEIVPMELEEQHFLVYRQRLPLDNMDGFMNMEGQNLRLAARQAGITATGPLTSLFYEWDMEAGIGEAAVALPVAAGTQLPPYVTITLPAGPSISTAMQGPYSQLAAYHFAMDAYLQTNGLTSTTPTREEYLMGPTATPDTNSFVTIITYPLLAQ